MSRELRAMRRVTGLIAMTLALVAMAPGPGHLGPVPARADCGMQAPAPDIAAHRGFALDGVVRSVEGRTEPLSGWLYRVTIDVSEMLAGEPVDRLVVDLGTGDCAHLQGDRYKVGDRLIVTASAPPTDGDVAYLSDALTWRYEWADHWSLHGLPEDIAASLSRPLREASSRDEILALVAPDRLPYEVAPGAWRVALSRPDGRGERLRDVVPWGDGFVALGGRVVNRHQGSRERLVATIRVSATGQDWERVRAPFPELPDTQASSVSRLVVFRERLYAVGTDGHRLRVWRSHDGVRWSPVDLGPEPGGERTVASATGRMSVVGAAATDDLMVVLAGPWSGDGGGDLVVTSVDGTTWSRSTPSGLLGPVEDLTPGPGGFLIRRCFCSQPDERWSILASGDGITWTEVGELPRHSTGIAFDATRARYLAATLEIHEDDRAYAALDASDDGVTWTRLVTAPGTRTSQVEVAASGDTIALLVGRYAPDDTRSLVMVSRDAGVTWSLGPLPGAREAECVAMTAIGTSSIVAIGDCAGRLAWATRP